MNEQHQTQNHQKEQAGATQAGAGAGERRQSMAGVAADHGVYTDTEKALLNALATFDAPAIDNIAKSGFRIADFLPDVRRQRNCVHELCRSALSLDMKARTPAKHIKFIDALNVLVRAGTSVNHTDFRNQTALHLLASSPESSPNALRVLVSLGTKVNAGDAGQQTALHKAVLHAEMTQVDALLESGASTHALDFAGDSPLHLAAKNKGKTEILRRLLKGGGNPNVHLGMVGLADLDKVPSTRRASRIPSESSSSTGTNQPGTPISSVVIGWTPLHAATKVGAMNNVEVLLQAGANVMAVDSGGQTPLHVAAVHDHSGVLLRRLIAAGARVNRHDDVMKQTALHKAVQADMARAVETLMASGADPNARDSWGETPLHYAARHRDVLLWHVLLNRPVARPDVFATNNVGATPLDIADSCLNSVAIAAMRPLAADWDN